MLNGTVRADVTAGLSMSRFQTGFLITIKTSASGKFVQTFQTEFPSGEADLSSHYYVPTQRISQKQIKGTTTFYPSFLTRKVRLAMSPCCLPVRL